MFSKLMGRSKQQEEKKADPNLSVAESVQKIREEIKAQEKLCEIYEKKIQEVRNQAENLLREGKKHQAANCLRKGLPLKKRIERCEGTILKLEEAVAQIEEGKVHSEVATVLDLARDGLKGVMKNVNVDDVAELKDGLNEMNDTVGDGMNMMAGAYANDMDEEDFQKEFEALNESSRREKRDDPNFELPEVPEHLPKVKKGEKNVTVPEPMAI